MNHSIPLDQAIRMTRLYRKQREVILTEAEQGKDILPICETFDAESVKTLLEQSGCVKLRVYYGMDTDQKVHAILVGVDANDADILPPATGNTGSIETTSLYDEGVILDEAGRCPTICPPPSSLNT